jgi:hypothetical protein
VRGDYEYSALNQYLNDFNPDDLSERSLSISPYYGNQVALYFYANDNWRVRPNLTVNLGLRSPKSQATNYFAPRIGIAYLFGTSGNTFIRACLGHGL